MNETNNNDIKTAAAEYIVAGFIVERSVSFSGELEKTECLFLEF